MKKFNESAVLGIDPGLKGGVALMLLDDLGESSSLVVTPMPIKPGPKGGHDIDGKAFGQFLDECQSTIKLACVELVHAMKGQGVTSSFTFGKGYGKVLGILEAMMIPMQHVSPQKWKQSILDGLGHQKEDAIRFALNSFPKTNFKATSKSTKLHDGMAEATCLAEFARRLLVQGQTTEAKPTLFVNAVPNALPDVVQKQPPVLKTVYKDDPEEDHWCLEYDVKNRRNKLILDAEPDDLEAALKEASKFLQIKPEEIEVVDD